MKSEPILFNTTGLKFVLKEGNCSFSPSFLISVSIILNSLTSSEEFGSLKKFEEISFFEGISYPIIKK